MRYVARDTALSVSQAKSFRLIGGGKARGVLYGLRATGRGLEPSFTLSGISTANAPQSAKSAYLSSDGHLYLYDGLNAVRRSTRAAGSFIPFVSDLTAEPFFAECHEGGEDFMIISDGVHAHRAGANVVESDVMGPVTGAVVHYSRMFGTDKDDGRLIRWSRAGDVHDWEESLTGAGHVRLDGRRGAIKKLIPYDNKLIAVREYGLTVLRIYGDAENFRVDCTDTDTDGIVASTAAVCAGKLYFFTGSGLYYYNGADIKKFSADGLCGFSQPKCAAGFGNVYFAGGKLDGEDVIACIEEDGICYLKCRADCICSAGRLLIYGDGLYEILPQAGGGEWDSGPTDFDCAGEKYLSELEVAGVAARLEVSCGMRTKIFENAGGRVKVGLKGRVFRIRAECPEGLAAVSAKYYERR